LGRILQFVVATQIVPTLLTTIQPGFLADVNYDTELKRLIFVSLFGSLPVVLLIKNALENIRLHRTEHDAKEAQIIVKLLEEKSMSSACFSNLEKYSTDENMKSFLTAGFKALKVGIVIYVYLNVLAYISS
ncbi:hypothetical protein H0X06_05730, partial [Candidatus Dependentiae bacterium]|nr:hypothetical protein [Candidatus Dependentiae bacterium]